MHPAHMAVGKTYRFSPQVTIKLAKVVNQDVSVRNAEFTHGVLERKDVGTLELFFRSVCTRGERSDGNTSPALCEFSIPLALAQSIKFDLMDDASGDVDNIHIHY